MDISNLIIQLQSKVSDNTYSQLAVTKSIELLKTGQVNYVNAYSELPAASTVSGYMYYVRGLGLYFSNGITWTRMDPVEYYNSIWAWGDNGSGRLGDGTTVTKSSPVSAVGFTDWCQVSAGGANVLAVRTNGTAWAWGSNGSGRLGDNTTVSRSSPVSVVGGFTDWCKVSGGTNHSLGLRQNGTLWAWGYNGSGGLGTNNTTSSSSPVSVVGGFTDWCQLWAGNKNSFGIRTNGVLYAWGYNNYGRLGTGDTSNFSSPVSVVGGFTDWCFVHNCNHTLAVRTNGTAWAWGCGYHGQLGNGLWGYSFARNCHSSPVSVVGGFTDWCQVAGGTRHSIGLRSNGTVYTWGCNARGQLGTNNTTSRNSPGTIVGGFTDWCQITAGYQTQMALRTNGTIWSWGYANQGVLGDNTVVSKSSPVSVVGGFTDWCQISAQATWALGLRSTPDNV
jgi:alpha-tubulin suppressor-like RCC1 family protein